MARGKFIVIEGCDGSGKSTLARALAEELNNQQRGTMLLREPGGCHRSEAIRNLALSNDMMGANANARMLLMFAARIQLCKETIEPALEQGINVVCDRYYISTGVYQVIGEGASSDLFESLIQHVTVPDQIYLLKATFETSYTRTLDRDQKDRNGYDDISLGRKKKLWSAYDDMDKFDLEYNSMGGTFGCLLDSETKGSSALVAEILTTL